MLGPRYRRSHGLSLSDATFRPVSEEEKQQGYVIGWASVIVDSMKIDGIRVSRRDGKLSCTFPDELGPINGPISPPLDVLQLIVQFLVKELRLDDVK